MALTPGQFKYTCNCELCVCVCDEEEMYQDYYVPLCPPCYIISIQNHIKDCMIGVYSNCITPDEIEDQISKWKPYASHGHREIEWDDYWETLMDEGIARHSGDIYSWLQLFGAPLPENELPNPHSINLPDYQLDEVESIYNIVAVSSDIKLKMNTAAKKGRNILIKRENMKKKYKSLINYVLYNKNQSRRYDASNVMLLQLTSYLI